tara:strand:+ start:6391 stop:7074 length:684 start_codon:yes stop_codon:yes gene_type:complete
MHIILLHRFNIYFILPLRLFLPLRLRLPLYLGLRLRLPLYLGLRLRLPLYLGLRLRIPLRLLPPPDLVIGLAFDFDVTDLVIGLAFDFESLIKISCRLVGSSGVKLAEAFTGLGDKTLVGSGGSFAGSGTGGGDSKDAGAGPGPGGPGGRVGGGLDCDRNAMRLGSCMDLMWWAVETVDGSTIIGFITVRDWPVVVLPIPPPFMGIIIYYYYNLISLNMFSVAKKNN